MVNIRYKIFKSMIDYNDPYKPFVGEYGNFEINLGKDQFGTYMEGDYEAFEEHINYWFENITKAMLIIKEWKNVFVDEFESYNTYLGFSKKSNLLEISEEVVSKKPDGSYYDIRNKLTFPITETRWKHEVPFDEFIQVLKESFGNYITELKQLNDPDNPEVNRLAKLCESLNEL